MNIWDRLRFDSPSSAAGWFARSRSGGTTEPYDRRLTQWLAKDPANEQAFEIMELIWQASGELKGDPRVDRLSGTASRAAPRSRFVWAGATIAASLALTISIVSSWHYLFPQATLYSTNVGEQRTIQLPDGSTMFLNTASSASVRYSPVRRQITLDAGEAIFDVAKSRLRPFEVSTAFGTARAVGTQFDVFVRPASVEVSIVEGTVAVLPSGRFAQRAVLARAGQAVKVDSVAGPSIMRADLDRILERHVQRLEFDRASVADAIREFNRYASKPVRAATVEVENRKVSGVFHAGDSEKFANSLAESLGLRVAHAGDAILLESRCDTQPSPATARGRQSCSNSRQ